MSPDVSPDALCCSTVPRSCSIRCVFFQESIRDVRQTEASSPEETTQQKTHPIIINRSRQSLVWIFQVPSSTSSSPQLTGFNQWNTLRLTDNSFQTTGRHFDTTPDQLSFLNSSEELTRTSWNERKITSSINTIVKYYHQQSIISSSIKQ